MTDPIAATWDLLRQVIDPETGISIVDMGLVYNVAPTPTGVVVTLTLTSEACPAGELVLDEVRARLSRLPEGVTAGLRLTFDPVWTPDRITPEGRQALGV